MACKKKRENSLVSRKLGLRQAGHYESTYKKGVQLIQETQQEFGAEVFV